MRSETADPGIARAKISTRNLEHDHPNHPANSPHAAPSTAPRWGGKKQPLTTPRRRAVDAKKAFCRAVRSGVLDGFVTGDQLLEVPLVLSPFVVAAALAEVHSDATAAALDVAGMRLFTRILAVSLAGGAGVIATHHELAVAIGASDATARRRLDQLLELDLLELVAYTFACNACSKLAGTCEHVRVATSMRAPAYRVQESVLGGIARVNHIARARLLKIEQPSGTVLEPGGPRGRPGSSENTNSLVAAHPPAERPSAGSVSAAPTVDVSAAAPDAATCPSDLERVKPECCGVLGGAPEGEVVSIAQAAWRRALRDAAEVEVCREVLAEKRAQSASQRALAPVREPSWRAFLTSCVLALEAYLDAATRPGGAS